MTSKGTIPWATMTDAERCACVAERVMGWGVQRGRKGLWDYERSRPFADAVDYVDREGAATEASQIKFTSDARAWWAVVERMRAVGVGLGLDYSERYRGCDPHAEAHMHRVEPEPPDEWWAAASRPGEAVCIAALRALGWEVEV